MTETLQRPSAAPPPPRRPAVQGRAPARVGATAALRVAATGLLVLGLPVLLVWAVDGRAGAGALDAVRTAGQLWLVAHGASLDVPGGRVALAPLALCGLPLLLLWRAGAAASRELHATTVRGAAGAAGWVAGAYAVLCGLIAVAARSAEVRPSLPTAVLGGLALGLLGAGAGALRPDRLWRAAWLRLSERTRRTLPAALAATAVLAGGGALLAGASLAWHGARAADLAGATAPGPVGGVALLLLGLALVPNAVVWGACWLAGPGFAVGTGTAVGPFGYELGPVPAVPLLAALPGTAVPTWVGAVALLVPLAAGVVAGRVLVRRSSAVSLRTCGDPALAALACGLLWTALAWVSGGSVGGSRLVDVGPSPWRVGLAVAAEVAVGAVAAVLVLRRRAAAQVSS